MRYYLVVLITALAAVAAGPIFAEGENLPGLKLVRMPEKAPEGTIQFSNVGAGAFDPAIWQAGTLNLLPDLQSPLLEPLPGNFRNIYAPSAVELPDGAGWRVFYGAWDGTADGHDRIYSVTTRDFRHFANRHTVIEHGPFHHICNVNAIRLSDGTFRMVCTAYPDQQGQNKPVIFQSPDGRIWNGSPAPYTASTDDFITLEGYEGFAGADINGMNVLLQEDGVFRLYFGDFKNFKGVYRASSTDGKHFAFDGISLDRSLAVNDVKKFRVGQQSHYLMGLHLNGDTLWYSLSKDGMDFQPVQTLAKSIGEEDRYIVAHGWVVQGGQELEDRNLLGFLYGAGSHNSLTMNRIFARWLQKKVELVLEDGSVLSASSAHGPNAQVIPVASRDSMQAYIRIYNEDGKTLLAESGPFNLQSGKTYRLSW